MRQHPRNRFLAAGSGLASVLLLGFTGCGSESPDRTVVVPEPGTSASGSAGAGTTATGPTTAATTDTKKAGAGPARQVVEGFGTLKGTIVYGGDPPERLVQIPQGKASKDPTVCAAGEPILSNYLVVNPENRGVANVLVYIPKPTAISPEAVVEDPEVIFDQENCIFFPHVLAVQKGGKIRITSSDSVSHNVNVGLRTINFNQSLNPGQEVTLDAQYEERSPGEVVCDIHPWMKAWWMVIDSPYFAVTDENGAFEIPNVPAGTQDVMVWHEGTGFIGGARGRPIDIEPDGETDISDQYEIDPASVRPEPGR
ncbi:hypothetical protein BH23PLA1_BH23PLA1_02730 [soil metagenome]